MQAFCSASSTPFLKLVKQTQTGRLPPPLPNRIEPSRMASSARSWGVLQWSILPLAGNGTGIIALPCWQRSDANLRLAPWPHKFGPIDGGLRRTPKMKSRGSRYPRYPAFQKVFRQPQSRSHLELLFGCNAMVLETDQKHTGCYKGGAKRTAVALTPYRRPADRVFLAIRSTLRRPE